MANRKARVLLKARPTTQQLADRLAPPIPDGVELYLDRLDLTAEDWLHQIRVTIEATGADRDFVWIVEAPIRTLNGAFFDLTADDDDHRETLRRVLDVGAAAGAVAANIHVVAPSLDVRCVTEERRRWSLTAARSLLDFYVDGCLRHGLVPQIENVPPVGRMRESAFVFSPIGLGSDDLLELIGARPEVRLTLDVSHAALFLNWKQVRESEVANDLRPVARFCRAIPGPTDLRSYAEAVAGVTTTVHVSNASGLLGEGLPYRLGAEDLDDVLGALIGKVSYFVTETLEANPERATEMRDAQQHLSRLRDVRGAHV